MNITAEEILNFWYSDDQAFEQAAADAGLVVAAARSFAQWDAHPQGRALEIGRASCRERV